MTRVLIFDSGVGGLSVAQEIALRLPQATQIYVADDAFRPYGNKPHDVLRTRLTTVMPYLERLIQVDMIVLACNTASTTALSDIRRVTTVPVIGVVPAIKPAAELSQSRKIVLLGTTTTVEHPYVDNLIKNYAQGCHVLRHGSVALVEQAELKLGGQSVDMEILRRELAPMITQTHIDIGVMACTHFPLLRHEIEALTPHITWIDSGEAIARRVATIEDDLVRRGVVSPTLTEPQAYILDEKLREDRQSTFAAHGFDSIQILNIPS